MIDSLIDRVVVASGKVTSGPILGCTLHTYGSTDSLTKFPLALLSWMTSIEEGESTLLCTVWMNRKRVAGWAMVVLRYTMILLTLSLCLERAVVTVSLSFEVAMTWKYCDFKIGSCGKDVEVIEGNTFLTESLLSWTD